MRLEIGDLVIKDPMGARAAALAIDNLKAVGGNFDDVKKWAEGEIRRLAEELRGELITLKPGKVWEYRQKEEEGRRWASTGITPTPEDYPIAEAERQEHDPPLSLVEMLQLWTDKVSQGSKESAKIAKRERRALVALTKVKDKNDVIDIFVKFEE